MKLFEVFGELIEDLIDRLYIFLRRNEPTIRFDEVLAELKRDGKLPDQYHNVAHYIVPHNLLYFLLDYRPINPVQK